MNKKANRLKKVLGYIINFVLNIGAIHYVYPENWLRVSTNYRKELTTWLFVVGSFFEVKDRMAEGGKCGKAAGDRLQGIAT